MSNVATYDQYRPEILFYQDSYTGGTKYYNPTPSVMSTQRVVSTAMGADGNRVSTGARTYQSYLEPHTAETPDEYQSRKDLSTYLNIVRPIVDAYAQGVTANVKRDFPQLQDFSSNVDYNGNSFDEVIQEFAQNFCVDGFGFAVLDTDDASPKIIRVRPSQVAWVLTDDYGRLEEFAYINNARPATDVGPSAQHFVIRVWNKAGWKDIAGAVNLSESTIVAESSKFEELKSGEIPPQLNGRIPVVCGFYERDSSVPFPYGASLVGDTCHAARSVYNQLSWATDILRKTGFPMLAIPVGDKLGGAMDPETKREIGPGRALPYGSQTGAPSYLQPSSDSTKELREHCMFLIRGEFTRLGLSMAADQSTQTVSGINLRVRAREFEARAAKFAHQMERFEREVVELMCLLAGVSSDGITIAYPKKFTLPDMSENIANAMSVIQLQTEHGIEVGPLVMQEACKELLSSALNVSDDMLSAMMDGFRSHMGQVDNAVSITRLAQVAHANATIAKFTPQPTPQPTQTDQPAQTDAAPAAPSPNAKDPQEAYNGAQVSSLIAIVTQVAQGILPRDSALGIMMIAFPVTRAQAESALGSAGLNPPTPAAPAAPAVGG